MPELPEVQTILYDLEQKGLIGQTILSVEVYWPKTVAYPSLSTFIQELYRRTILALDRRGKYLIFHLSGEKSLVVHLRMTGRLLLTKSDLPVSPYVRLLLRFENGWQLHYHDTRKFGRWSLVNDPEEILHRIGLEPLSPQFNLPIFKKALQQKKRALKPLLLDQTFVAGLGNIYVDEALWEAYLHPLQPANQLSAKQIEALYYAIVLVLKRGIESQGTTLGKGKTNFYRLEGQQGEHQTQLQVFRRTGKPCPRCGHLIQRLIVAQRGTHICPHCQRLKHPLKLL